MPGMAITAVALVKTVGAPVNDLGALALLLEEVLLVELPLYTVVIIAGVSVPLLWLPGRGA